jgi:hypothetical protein
MPNYVAYRLKSTGKEVTCQEVDDLMCKHFGVPTDPKDWYLNWYNHIAMLQSAGRTWDQLREDYHDYQDFLRIIDWMEATFTVDAWYSR